MMSCSAKPILSTQEERILTRVRELKRRLRSARADGADADQLAVLRGELDRCRQELQEANRVKWRLLGYEI